MLTVISSTVGWIQVFMNGWRSCCIWFEGGAGQKFFRATPSEKASARSARSHLCPPLGTPVYGDSVLR